MGSVRHLYTTGDNDPELEPRQYYRHYLYCDGCGSFGLEPWTNPGNDTGIQTRRRRLGLAALLASALALVSAWRALGLFPSPPFFVLLATGIALALAAWGFIWKFVWRSEAPLATRWSARWRFFKATLPVLAVLAVAQWLVDDFLLPPVTVLLVAVATLVALLAWRAVLAGKIEYLGLRCKQCGATYAYGTPFFTDLDANPRNLNLEVVPRPLGVSPFEVGDSVEGTVGSEQPAGCPL